MTESRSSELEPGKRAFVRDKTSDLAELGTPRFAHHDEPEPSALEAHEKRHFDRATISMCDVRWYRRLLMSGSPVELRVGGQTYRVVASADEAELRRLADVVDTKLRELTAPGRQLSPQSLLLVAIALAHELEEERERRLLTERRWREKLTSLLARVDAAIDATTAFERHSALESSPHDS